MKYLIATASIALLFPLSLHNKFCTEGTSLRFGTVRDTYANITVAKNAQVQHCRVLEDARTIYGSRFN